MAVGSTQSIADAENKCGMAEMSQVLIGQYVKSHNIDQPTGQTCKIM